MVKEPEPDHAYGMQGLNLWFAASCLLLLLALVGAVVGDYRREWKEYQRGFQEIEKGRAEAELARASQMLDQDRLQEVRARVEESRAALGEHRGDLEAKDAAVFQANGEIYKLDARARTTKSIIDATRYRYEEHRHAEDEQAEELKQELDALLVEYQAQRDAVLRAQEALEALRAEKKALTSQADEAQAAVDALLKEQTRLEDRLAKLEPPPIEAFRDAPLLDFINPTLRVRQVITEKARFDMNYTTIPTTDRCQTCHLAVEKEGYEAEAQPFRSHPRLDVFLSSTSPHPAEEYACTVCHGGRSWGTSFQRASHTPSDHETAELWSEEHGWDRMHHWDFPMLSKEHSEAYCLSCHSGEDLVPAAQVLNTGLRLIEEVGCFGCHKMERFPNMEKVGPPLRTLAAKLDKDWVLKWVEDPRSFNPHATMPRLFGLSNTTSPEDREKSKAEIDAVVSYLFDRSQPRVFPAPPPGDADRGERLFNDRGCQGCHALTVSEDEPFDRLAPNHFGPVLSSVGSKADPGWLNAWIQDPKKLNPQARMPNLRIDARDAADLTTFLLTLRNDEFDEKRAPQGDPAVVDALVLDILRDKMTEEEAEAELRRMQPEERKVWLGGKVITSRGCFGCHDIGGFETAQPIGVELSEIGSKSVHLLDFGFAHIEHTLDGWLEEKLLDPRVYDAGRERAWREKLKMPDFGFREDEISAVVTALLGFNTRGVAPDAVRVLSGREQAIERGRRIIREKNCQACHVLDGQGGLLAATLPLGMGPPNLVGEGMKVRPEWLFDFLQSPSTIRPWLTARMPTFEFTDEETNDLVRFFAELDREPFPYASAEEPRTDRTWQRSGETLFKTLQCLQCHQELKPGQEAADLAPNLNLASERLKSGWIVEWLEDPNPLQPGTRMPSYWPLEDEDEPDGPRMSPTYDILDGDAASQMRAIRDYLMTVESIGAS